MVSKELIEEVNGNDGHKAMKYLFNKFTCGFGVGDDSRNIYVFGADEAKFREAFVFNLDNDSMMPSDEEEAAIWLKENPDNNLRVLTHEAFNIRDTKTYKEYAEKYGSDADSHLPMIASDIHNDISESFTMFSLYIIQLINNNTI